MNAIRRLGLALAIGAFVAVGVPDARAAGLPYRAYALIGSYPTTSYGVLVDALGPLANLEVTRFDERGQPACKASISLRLGEFTINPFLAAASLNLNRPAPCTQGLSRLTIQWSATTAPEYAPYASVCRSATVTTSTGLPSPFGWMCVGA